MNRYLLDSNTLIAAIRGQAEVRRRLQQIDAAALALSSIVLGELLVGVGKSQVKTRSQAALEAVVSNLEVVSVNADVSRTYGTIRAELELAGQPIGANDFWIAAQAVTFGMILVTDNLREFERVPELKLENWVRVGGET